MPQGISTGDDPEAQIDGKPGSSIIIGMTIKGGRVATQNVLQLAVRQITALGGRDHHEALRGWVDPVVGRFAVGANPIHEAILVKVVLVVKQIGRAHV